MSLYYQAFSHTVQIGLYAWQYMASFTVYIRKRVFFLRGSSYLGVCGETWVLPSSCVTGFPKTPLVNRHFPHTLECITQKSHYKWTMRHVALLTLCNPKKACSWWCGRDWRGVSQGLIFEVCLVKQAAGEGNPTAALRPGLVKSTTAPSNWSLGTNLWPANNGSLLI